MFIDLHPSHLQSIYFQDFKIFFFPYNSRSSQFSIVSKINWHTYAVSCVIAEYWRVLDPRQTQNSVQHILLFCPISENRKILKREYILTSWTIPESDTERVRAISTRTHFVPKETVQITWFSKPTSYLFTGFSEMPHMVNNVCHKHPECFLLQTNKS